MTVHKVFTGGVAAKIKPSHQRHSEAPSVVRYAGHLQNRNFVIPFIYDGAGDTWSGYREMHGGFATGDTLQTHLLSADTLVKALVFHNKKPAGDINADTGAVTTPAKIKIALYDGETKVEESAEIDLSKVGRTVLEFNKAATKKTTAKDTNNDGVVNDKDTPETFVSTRGAYLGKNGTARIEIVDGTGINSACFSMFADITDFYDEKGCTCGSECCPNGYADAKC